MMMMMIMLIIIIIVIIIILLVVQVSSSSSSSSSSFFCVSECFFNRCLAVWYPFCFSGQAVYPFTAIKPSSRSSSFFYLFIYFVIFHSILSLFLSVFFYVQLPCVAWEVTKQNDITSQQNIGEIVTNIFAHEINVIRRRGQIKKELFFVGSVWENICVNTDIGVKWQ